ncbi:DUF2937 family protein [Algibacillus agarilyticus]|uniref:DUF2937 family protein n=1 Tax=Algibacillus agarilyticus TaxID=2234133 RepID=UPI000DCFF1B0|nr:DUF2937 family protein [Algibacillus agarilyticus]
MVLNVLDKTLFTVLLLSFFQLPTLINEYLQFVNGYYQATQVQVEGWKQNAKMHEYINVQAMIDEFKQNENPAVRTDAQQKEATLKEYDELIQAIRILKEGTFFEKTHYIFHPQRWPVLREVVRELKPSIPLNIKEVGYSFLSALLLSSLIMCLIKLLFVGKNRTNRTEGI